MQGNKFQYIIVLITCSSKKEATKIKDVLLTEKKAACINVFPPKVNSFFWWQGKIDSCSEVLLVVKTRRDVFKDVVSLVKKNHKYEVPEIIALPIINGNKDYLKWIDETVK